MTPRRALGRGPHTAVAADFGAKVVPFAMPPQDPTPQLHRPAWPPAAAVGVGTAVTGVPWTRR